MESLYFGLELITELLFCIFFINTSSSSRSFKMYIWVNFLEIRFEYIIFSICTVQHYHDYEQYVVCSDKMSSFTFVYVCVFIYFETPRINMTFSVHLEIL